MGFVYPIGGKTYGNEQNKVTKNGTLKSTTNPWKIETTTKLSPAVLVIIGRVVSIVVAPPDDMGARFPNHLTSKGANSSVIISSYILYSKEIVHNSDHLYSVMKMLDNE